MIFVISADAVGRFPAVGKFLHALSKSKSKSKKHRDNHSKAIPFSISMPISMRRRKADRRR
jgi:hypothetical protein